MILLVLRIAGPVALGTYIYFNRNGELPTEISGEHNKVTGDRN